MTSPPVLQSNLLKAVPRLHHGFFGRQNGDGGALDVSESLGTPPERVAANRRAAMTAIGATALPLATLAQKHTNTVLTLDALPEPDARPIADGMVTALPNLALGIVTADCAPVLFADPEAGVIGACHAGWQGAVDGIVRNTVAAMTALGATQGRILAAIGPTISFANYEVGADFAARLKARNPDVAPFLATTPGSDTPHFDLPGFLAAELARLGLARDPTPPPCTYSDPARFFSHRHVTHHAGAEGRQISLIARLTD